MNTSTSTSLHFARLALALACGFGSLPACEQIIGLEERKPAEDGDGGSGGANAPDSRACIDYCNEVVESCDASGVQAYRSVEECRAVCSFLPPGRSGVNNDANNSLMCRARAASEAADADAMFCPAAAPGGGSPTAETRCGSNCETYCALYESVCGEDQFNCLEVCSALPDRGGFSAEQDFAGGDTIQCRLSHLAAAAVHQRKGEEARRRTECNNALLSAALDRRDHCDLPKNTEPNCPDYCRLVDAACGDHPQYESPAQCEMACERGLFPKGTNTVQANDEDVQDSTFDTLACRRWHVYFAMENDEMAQKHCPHAGPSGDGHCGAPSACTTYCSMLERSCKNVFEREFPAPNGRAACVTACKGLRGALNEAGEDADIGYDLSSEESRTNTLQCRVAHLVRAMSGMNACERALPRGTCSR